MIPASDGWVFDTGPLRHFARHGWLGVLRFVAADHPVYIPDTVERELHETIDYEPAVRQVLDADWITVCRPTESAYLAAFGSYYDRLVADGKTSVNAGFSR